MDSRKSAPGGPPPSDVSAAVGFAGLLGLFAWLSFCRNWGILATALDLPGAGMRLDGPYASVLAVVFSGLPMVLWSLLVEKVHRRPSTGLDWTRARPVRAIFDISVTKLAGLWATWALIGFIYCIARYYWRGQYLFSMEMMGAAIIPLLLLSVPYVLWLDRVMVNPRDHAWHFGAMLIGREAYDPDEVKAHLRSWAVKGFFIAFMISILPPGWKGIVNVDPVQALGDPVQLSNMLIQLLFVIDVQIAMVGYLLTLRPLDAHIRSANPFLAGWVAALMCYPPFLLMSGGDPLDYHPNTADWSFWMQGQFAILWVWGAVLVFLTGVYAWATVAFGLRFSNLTYRGVLTNGPYRYTRHPAYISKNAFWWLSTMPFLVTSGSMIDAIRNTIILALVSAIYYWRARTEEAHLLAEDPKYRAYYDWMQEHGLITGALARLTRTVRRRGAVPQAAE
ncbi:MAG: DUF1295 domain-containing protein [Novosphingobium sp.]|nr:DUF1295 domain-containing protein [Novosphingobium sp.]